MANRSGRAPVNPMTGRPNEIAGARDLEHADQAAQGEAPGAARRSADPATDPETSWATVLGRLRAVVDSRWVSTVVLGALCFAVLGMENIIVLAAVFFIGYVLIERFLEVRRAITMGGTIWLAVLFMGGVATAQAPQLYVSIDYIFVFCGFLLALAVCAALFSARSAYAHGCARGREEADGAIARNMVDRLIEHPDNWDDLDSDYLEVESALNRVRERERLAAQALRDESGRKDDLVTYLAHDLKTPLTVLRANADFVAEELEDEKDADLAAAARDIAGSVERLDGYVRLLIEASRGSGGAERAPMRPAELCEQVLAEAAQIARARGMTLDAATGPAVAGAPEAPLDRTALARAAANLVANAAEHARSRVAVSCDVEGGHLVIEVADDGPGFSPAALERGCERLFTDDSSRSSRDGGRHYGLGLHAASEAASAHGGSVSLANSPSGGAVATIAVPL